MTHFKIGDRVCVRGLVQSDCLGLTGTILGMSQSALFGPKIHRCTVDFNGKVRRVLSIHLTFAAKRNEVPSAAA